MFKLLNRFSDLFRAGSLRETPTQSQRFDQEDETSDQEDEVSKSSSGNKNVLSVAGTEQRDLLEKLPVSPGNENKFILRPASTVDEPNSKNNWIDKLAKETKKELSSEKQEVKERDSVVLPENNTKRVSKNPLTLPQNQKKSNGLFGKTKKKEPTVVEEDEIQEEKNRTTHGLGGKTSS